jgi:ATP-dependent RNA helicase DeaD
VPHSSFATWEPTAEKDDDQPIFAGGATEAPKHLPEPPPLPGIRESSGRDEPRAQAPGGVQLFVNVGRRDGARASDLQGMLEAGGLGKDEIGQIRIRDRNSFVSLPKEAAERGIAALTGKTVGSRGVIAEIARPRPGDS